MFDRLLLARLSWCAWIVLSLYLTGATSLEDAKAGAVIVLPAGRYQQVEQYTLIKIDHF